MSSRDEVAQGLFGASYDAISAFGKRYVDSYMATPPATSVSMNDIDVMRALELAQQRVARLERENRDLWEENEDLQLQLLEYEDEGSASGSTGQRQAGTRVRASEEVSDVPAEAPGFSLRTDNQDTQQSD